MGGARGAALKRRSLLVVHQPIREDVRKAALNNEEEEAAVSQSEGAGLGGEEEDEDEDEDRTCAASG